MVAIWANTGGGPAEPPPRTSRRRLGGRDGGLRGAGGARLLDVQVHGILAVEDHDALDRREVSRQEGRVGLLLIGPDDLALGIELEDLNAAGPVAAAVALPVQ